MTLPAKLSEMLEEHTAHCYCAGPTCSGCEENTAKLISIGFHAALALPELAELVEAAQKYLRKVPDDVHYEDCDFVTDEEADCSCGMTKAENDLIEALAKWKAFVKGDK